MPTPAETVVPVSPEAAPAGFAAVMVISCLRPSTEFAAPDLAFRVMVIV